MTKEKIKQLVDVMQAYVNGRTIQYYKVELNFKIKDPVERNSNNTWVDVDEDHIFRPDLYNYRIKPEPNYRPFKNAEECWHEMQKHHPFGWIKDTENDTYTMVTNVDADELSIDGNPDWGFDDVMRIFTFADGTPFGINDDL